MQRLISFLNLEPYFSVARINEQFSFTQIQRTVLNQLEATHSNRWYMIWFFDPHKLLALVWWLKYVISKVIGQQVQKLNQQMCYT